MSAAAGTPPARPGITVPFDGIPLHAHREWFARLRELGYTDIWSAEVDGADGFTPLALAAAWEPSLNLGVAITPAYTAGPPCWPRAWPPWPTPPRATSPWAWAPRPR